MHQQLTSQCFSRHQQRATSPWVFATSRMCFLFSGITSCCACTVDMLKERWWFRRREEVGGGCKPIRTAFQSSVWCTAPMPEFRAATFCTCDSLNGQSHIPTSNVVRSSFFTGSLPVRSRLQIHTCGHHSFNWGLGFVRGCAGSVQESVCVTPVTQGGQMGGTRIRASHEGYNLKWRCMSVPKFDVKEI